MQAVTLIQDAQSVHKPLRPVGFDGSLSIRGQRYCGGGREKPGKRGERDLASAATTMRDRTSIQQVEQLMSFMGFLLEEEEISGKEIWLCLSNL